MKQVKEIKKESTLGRYFLYEFYEFLDIIIPLLLGTLFSLFLLGLCFFVEKMKGNL